MAEEVVTRFFILSDTHGDRLPIPAVTFDVAIHAGDLTEESKLDEFKDAISLLREVNAPLKLVIPGNHDFTLDEPMFKRKLAAIEPPPDDDLVKREYGAFGEVSRLFDDATKSDIVLLGEGTHKFKLANGALLTVYASPYTASLSDWGFQYHPQQGHDWSISKDVDVVITHGPPNGVLDYTDSQTRSGCPGLFAAVARARPRLHCFGHIHEGWGAKRVTWRDTPSDQPSHFTDIDNDESHVVQNLAGLRANRYDDTAGIATKKETLDKYMKQRYYPAKEELCKDINTLFVNAAIQGPEEGTWQLPWLVEIKLPRAPQE
ncbi:hypothetical protein LTR78_009853 [Recurvomyces mirabilis]|uniref:Calcineurin-like phosphoesterase domain-containing protein n=1 Tax=Recurvomyces mirabilis TaxID=574656 RepID=A0AAE0WGE8_9PEZI|nr:hypothetical protein LTR78_009853 [Recurvomyces mirabilis]KAK5153089.1 hypothetical protein LTS14_007733 [Recurvomyces mirabilis]